MEKLSYKYRNAILATALSAVALIGCSVESYSTDPLDVQCDSNRNTKTDLAKDGMTTFVVHGSEEDDIAAIKVRRNSEGVSTAVSDPETEELEFTTPVPVVEGAELTVFATGIAWVIDVHEDSVVIQGSC